MSRVTMCDAAVGEGPLGGRRAVGRMWLESAGDSESGTSRRSRAKPQALRHPSRVPLRVHRAVRRRSARIRSGFNCFHAEYLRLR